MAIIRSEVHVDLDTSYTIPVVNFGKNVANSCAKYLTAAYSMLFA